MDETYRHLKEKGSLKRIIDSPGSRTRIRNYSIYRTGICKKRVVVLRFLFEYYLINLKKSFFQIRLNFHASSQFRILNANSQLHLSHMKILTSQITNEKDC